MANVDPLFFFRIKETLKDDRDKVSDHIWNSLSVLAKIPEAAVKIMNCFSLLSEKDKVITAFILWTSGEISLSIVDQILEITKNTGDARIFVWIIDLIGLLLQSKSNVHREKNRRDW